MGHRDPQGAPDGFSFAQALDYIHGLNRLGWKLGLTNIKNLLARIGDPQRRLRVVHVAGTNGKGSTSTFIAAALREAGYRTGLFTSPYLTRFTERIQIDGEEIPGSDLARLAGDMRSAIAGMVADGCRHPTEFEVVTAIAMAYYAERNCDVVVLEVGLGGRYDSTNVIDDPIATVIATIGYDHMAYLGDTLEKIAYEKGGIMKAGREAVLYPQNPSVLSVFARIAEDVGAPLSLCDFSTLRLESRSLREQSFSYKGYEHLRIGMLGDFQLRNAALAIDALEAVNRGAGTGTGTPVDADASVGTDVGVGTSVGTDVGVGTNVGAGAHVDAGTSVCAGTGGHGIYVPERAIRAGLEKARLPGRMEVVRRAPPFVVDVAHNAQCAVALRDALEAYFPGKRAVFVFGMLEGKDHDAVIDATMPLADAVLTVTPDSPRATSAETLAEKVRRRFGRLDARACGSIAEAVDAATELASRGSLVACAFGSFFFTGKARKHIMESPCELH